MSGARACSGQSDSQEKKRKLPQIFEQLFAETNALLIDRHLSLHRTEWYAGIWGHRLVHTTAA